MKNILFEKFLRTGQFGILNLDFSITTVLDVLGEPDYNQLAPVQIPNSELRFLYYGDVLFWFLDNELVSIDIEIYRNENIPEELGYGDYDYLCNLDLSDLRKILKSNNHTFNKISPKTDFVDDGSVLIWVSLDKDKYFLFDFFDPNQIRKIKLTSMELGNWNVKEVD